MIELLTIQWGIIGVIVLFHFILGFLRGTSKSVYFTIVSIFLTFVTLWIISLFTIRWFFTPETLLATIESYAPFAIPAEFKEYFLDPNLNGFVFAMVDLVLRIIGFLSLYPLIKGLLTVIIFKPIWKGVILKQLLIKQNEDLALRYEGSEKLKKSKKLNKTLLSRCGGGMSGAVRGLVVAFVFLLPVIILGGFLSEISDTEPVNAFQETQTLSKSTQLNSVVPTNLEEILQQVLDMHRHGLGGLTQQIRFNGQSIDRALFDMIFTVDIVADNEKTPINFGQEFESITGVAGILLSKGYLSPEFNIESIDKTNLEDLDKIFSYIKQSQLLGYMIQTAARFGVETILIEEIGVNLYEKENTKEALEAFENIDWNDEFSRIYVVLEKLLEFGSIAEIMIYAENPALLAELSPEEGEQLADIIRAFSELNSLVLLNVAVDYALSLESVQSQITWIEESEREAYLEERFNFILSNKDFFIGESSDWATIAEMIEVVFSDEYGDVDLAAIFAKDPQAIFSSDHADWMGALLSKFVEIELIMNMIPMGIDFVLYNALGDQIEAELAENISQTLSELDWEAELLDISDIYVEITKLGISSAFGENPSYFAVIDNIAVNHMSAMRSIISRIFEDSQVFNAAIEIAFPIIINTTIQNESLREIAKEALYNNPESSEIDFNFGYEINQWLTLIEIINEFSSTSQIAGISNASTEERLQLLLAFGQLPQARLDAFTETFSNLQLIERVGEQGLKYIKESAGIEMLYVPSEVDLAEDINSIFELIYYISGYINDKELEYGYLEDIDFTEMLQDDEFRAFLLSTPTNKHSELLFLTIAYNLRQELSGTGLEGYLTIPEDLMAEDIEADIWKLEINSLIGTLLNLIVLVGQTEELTLSVRGLSEAVEDSSALFGTVLSSFFGLIDNNIDLETGKDDFDRFLDSKIVYVSISDLLQGDILIGFIEQALSGVFGSAGESIDLSAPSTTIGLEGVHDEIEVGRITKNEIKKIFSSLEVLGITNPDDAAELGLSVITNLIDINNANDDFMVFLDSDYIYVLIARLFSMEALGSFLGNALGGALGGELEGVNILPPVDAIGSFGVEEGLITRVEIRQLFVSFKLLNIEGALSGESIGIHNILDLIEEDLPLGETDDFHLFLESKYIWDKISNLLLSDALLSAISFGRFPPEDFVLPSFSTVTIGDKDRLTEEELRYLFRAFSILGFSDFGSSNFGVNSIISLEEAKLNQILDSTYLYFIIDLMLKSESNISVPLDAYESTGDFNNIIKKTEIISLIKALNILGVADLGTFNPSAITLDDIEALLDLNSSIVDQLISDAIVQALTGQQVGYQSGTSALSASTTPISLISEIPVGAFNESQTRLLKSEIYALLDALRAINIVSLETPIALNMISLNQLKDIHYIGLGIDPILDEHQSLLVHRLISSAINNAVDVPEDAFMTIDKLDLNPLEISALIEALEVLGLTSLDNPIEINTLTTLKLKSIHYIGLGIDPGGDTYNSLIVHRLISSSLIEALDVPDDAYMTNLKLDLKPGEIGGLIAAMEELNIVTLSIGLSFTNPTRNQIIALNYIGLDVDPIEDKYNSYIVHRMLSSATMMILDVPIESMMPGSLKDVKAEEIRHITDTMTIIGINDLNDFSQISIGVLSALDEADVEFMVESETNGPNYIVYYLLANIVDPSNNIFDALSLFNPIEYPDPDAYYVYEGLTRLRLKRDSIIIALNAS